MKSYSKFFVLSGFLVFLFFGCDTIECGDGTVEKNGVCVLLNIAQPDGGQELCAAGSHWNVELGKCFLDPTLICGTGTEVVWLDEEQTTFTCNATGAPELPPCPTPDTSGHICINGKIQYFIDPNDKTKFMSSEITDASLLASMEIVIYDPLDYAASGSDSIPLGYATIDATSGAFIATHIAVPSQGYVGLVVRDKGWTIDSTPVNWLFTGVAYKASAGENLEDYRAVVVTESQVNDWQAELPQGYMNSACAEGDIYGCGTWIGIYRDRGQEELTPIDGVTPYYKTNLKIPAESLAYIDKNASQEYVTITPGTDRDSTSETGIVMYFGAELTTYFGLCDAWVTDSSCNAWQMEFPQSLQGGASEKAIFIQFVDGTRLNK